jgi:polyhydroxybutyrate depolymerase
MNVMIRTQLIALLFLMLLQIEAASQSSDYEKTLKHGNRVRKYFVHLPSGYNNENAYPLVIVLHGGGGAPEGMARTSNFNKKADAEKFIVVYPAGTGRFESRFLTWNSGNCCGYALDDNVDDTGFIRTVIQQLQSELNIDEARIYATGLSNGAMMSYRLACELSDKIAAIGSVSGAFNFQPCVPTHPVSIVILHGTADQHVLFNGGPPKKQADRHERTDVSVADSMAFWIKHNRCPQTPKKDQRGKVQREAYEGCTNNSGVTLFTIQNEGHTWPGGIKWAFWADEPTKEISATDVIWEFFAKHPKQKTPLKKPQQPQTQTN